MKTSDQTGDRQQSQHRSTDTLPENCGECKEERFIRAPDCGRAGRDAGVEKQGQAGGDNQRENAPEQGFRHIPLRVVGLLSGQRELLDGKVEPDGEGQGLGDTRPAEGQKTRIAVVGLDVQRNLPTEMG